ncbi:MAG: carbon-nitrogen hydrolase family protein [bacterium]
MKVAAFQAPLAACYANEALDLIREQVTRCEALGVEFLCCPEGAIGGLADYAERPASIAIDVGRGQLDEALAPLASETVTTIVGFTETDGAGRLYNSAAVFHRTSVVGIYRKLHPAINRSVYTAGHDMPVFTVGGLTFGVVICRDSMFSEPATNMVARGATALFVPTNNGMPSAKGGPGLVAKARACDVARAVESGVSVIRADVAGQTLDLVADGCSGIVSRDGVVLASAQRFAAELVVADIGASSLTNTEGA